MLTTLLIVIGVSIVAVISPGPDFVIVSRNSMAYSRKVGVATALGIATGNIWWIAASMIGITYLISTTVILYTIIKFAGAAYLIYLGIQSLRSKQTDGEDVHEERKGSRQQISVWRGFRIGLFTNLLNPKCAFFFVSFFGALPQDTTVPMRCVYGGVVMIIAVSWFSFLATVLSLKKIKESYKRLKTTLDRVTGAVLILLGAKIALSRT